MKLSRQSLLMLVLGVSSLTLTHCSKGEKACEFQTDPAQIKMEWTAFKTTAKTPVKGRFNTAKVSGNAKADSLANLAKGLKMEIDGATVETDNPGRNATIQQFFFEKFNPPSKIDATVTDVQGDDSKGTVQIQIQTNGVSQTLPFAYQVDGEGNFSATATLSMPAFSLQAAFDALHQACADQHKGTDGVSKTWEEVDLKVSGKVNKSCH